MQTPVLIVNFKTYEKGSKEEALKLAITCEKLAKSTDQEVAVAVQNADVHRIAEKVDIPVLAQHADSEGYGSNTGKDILETLKFNGASGVIINHSEDKTSLEEIEKVVKRCRKNEMDSIVCVDDISLGESVTEFKSDFVAYEPEELIGGDVSVSESKPEVIEEIVEKIGRKTTVLTGAGVKDSKDVEKALELGTDGVLIASGIVKAGDKEEAIEDILSPF